MLKIDKLKNIKNYFKIQSIKKKQKYQRKKKNKKKLIIISFN